MDDAQVKRRLNVRVDPDLHDRATSAAERYFEGSEAMLMRQALEIYLDLRDSLGFDFDRVIQPMRETDAVALAS